VGLVAPVLLGAVLLSACSLPGSGWPPAAARSGIAGRVVIGSVCPSVQEGQSCPDEPFAATIVVREREDGREVLTLQTGPDGRFRADLAPGTYVLVPVAPNPGAPPNAEPQVVTVEPGRYTRVTIRYDSGIR
jgi:hypothetical protein